MNKPLPHKFKPHHATHPLFRQHAIRPDNDAAIRIECWSAYDFPNNTYADFKMSRPRLARVIEKVSQETVIPIHYCPNVS